MNLVVALLVLGGAALAVRAGLIDPPGGVLGDIGRALRGEPQPTRKTPPTAADLLGGGTGGTPPAVGAGAGASGQRAAVIAAAKAQLGKPYKWGGNGPASFDCSGLTVWSFAHGAGIKLPRTAAQQQFSTLGRSVAVADAQPGDLVFYGSPASHVALVIGGGQVIDAPRPGKSVEYAALATAGYPNKPTSARAFLP